MILIHLWAVSIRSQRALFFHWRKHVFQWMMTVTHIRHGSTDPFAYIAASLPTSSHKVPRKRKCTINVTYLRQEQSNSCLQEADIFVQIFSWRRGKDLWWERLRGRWGCFAEWLRVWCGVQWWRREDTADSFSCFLQPLASSLKHMVVLTENKKEENMKVIGIKEGTTNESRRKKVMENLGLRSKWLVSSSEFDPESSWKQVSWPCPPISLGHHH